MCSTAPKNSKLTLNKIIVSVPNQLDVCRNIFLFQNKSHRCRSIKNEARKARIKMVGLIKIMAIRDFEFDMSHLQAYEHVEKMFL